MSLFAKIFGRKKKKLASAGATTAGSTSSGGGNQSSEVEYATFSAQFPPAEWVWYQQQIERHRRTEEWVSQQRTKPFSSTGAEASSGGVDSGNHDMTLTEFSHPTTDAYASSKSHVYATLGHMQGVAESRGIYAANGQNKQAEQRLKQANRLSGSHAKKSHSHNHHEHHHHKHKENRKTLHENNYDIPVNPSRVPISGNTLPGSMARGIMDMTPLTIEPDSVYATPGPGQSDKFVPWHSTPCYDVPPLQLDSNMPSNIIYSSTQEQSDAVKPHRHRPHRSKRERRGHRQYYYDSGNDITIEYKGRMPKKNSSVAQSRDSGVNCIAGLPRNRQVYMNQPDLHMMQESFQPAASADQPTLTTTATVTTSSLQPHTMSTQRGTPYTSMEQRSPEGSSGDHVIIINDIGNDIAGCNEVDNSRGGGVSARGDGLSLPNLEDRLECEGTSQEMTTHFVAMSYCDSSLGDEGAGGGEVILCQAEINQFQIPQLVLDTEPHLNRSNLSAEPDVALSSAGSKDTLDRTADESERSVETVIHSPKAKGGPDSSRTKLARGMDSHEDLRLLHKGGGPKYAQLAYPSSSNDVTPTGDSKEMTGDADNQVVSALGNELQEMGVVDSGFSSPRNTDDKENQNQQGQPATTATIMARQAQQRNDAEQARNHNHHHHHHGTEAEECAAPEHKSKHERIKAYVKQSNQLLEQRQFISHAYNANMARYPPDVASYPACHPHHYALQQQHYASVQKPLHPIQQPPPQHHLQQQQQQMLSNQRHFHHVGRQQPMHAAGRERPRSQTMWPGDKVAPSDLQAFQQQQLSNKNLGLNGEFEVMGVV